MDVEIQTLLDSLADLREKANVNACFGDPVTVEGRTVIPVAKIGYGFAVMAGHETMAEKEVTEKTTEKSGSGGGAVRARPLAIVEMTPERVWPLLGTKMSQFRLSLSAAGRMVITQTSFLSSRIRASII